MDKLRQKILNFINSPKDIPLLAGFILGVYMLSYYYSKNFSLANSWIQFGFFICYYILLPMAGLYAGYKFFGFIKKGKWQKKYLFVAIPVLISFYLLQLSWFGEYKRYIFGGIILIAILLSFKLAKYYKAFVVLFAFMALFNLPPLVSWGYVALTADEAWKKQPDGIETIIFKNKPNIYYLQPDGYASFSNLRNSPYNYDNGAFETFLKQQGFTLYNDYRSNYFSTLLSNTSMFSMKHHYVQEDIEDVSSRNIIMGDNPVLRILKNNGYKTHFISDKPYLLVNRPKLGYTDTNFEYADLPFIKDGWSVERNASIDFLKAINTNSGKAHFYFLEKMVPSHITGLKQYSAGSTQEREMYLERLKESNDWIRKTISRIGRHDPNALIIIAADHGGFVGFDYTLQSEYASTNPQLTKSVFGAMLAIKWNNPDFAGYDDGLKTSVNLFRTVFSVLAQDKKYLQHLQENGSYIKMLEPKGLHCVIDTNGKVTLHKKE